MCRLDYGLGLAQGTTHYVGAEIPQGERAILYTDGNISRPAVKYREYPACGRYSQPDSVGGSSDAAFRCHDTIRYDMLFNVQSKTDTSQLNLQHGTNN